jgi:S-adenosylmethionine synthetase
MEDEKMFDVLKKNTAGFVVEQCCTVEHACVRIETDLGGSIEDPRGLVGMQVQQVGE